MKLDLKKLDTLREKLAKAKDFSDPMNYFFDHFGENDEFMGLGERIQDPFLEGLIQQLGIQIFPGQQVHLISLMLTRLPEHKFIHGGFTLNGQLGNIIYFEEACMGLMAIVTLQTSGETKFMRFSGKPMLKSHMRSNN